MPDLKLGKLPDRTPIRMTINLMPDLAAALSAYAEAYREAYGREEPVTDLVPAILTKFLENDRGFQRRLQKQDH